MRSASSGVAGCAKPVMRMATTSSAGTRRGLPGAAGRRSRSRGSSPERRDGTGCSLAMCRADSALKSGEHSHLRHRSGKPLLKRPPDGFLVVHDEYGVGHGTLTGGHKGGRGGSLNSIIRGRNGERVTRNDLVRACFLPNPVTHPDRLRCP